MGKPRSQTMGGSPLNSAPVLELRNLARRWPGSPEVFSGLNLAVEEGGFTVLLGPSGCGKSTLLRCAASLDKPDEGEVLVDGLPETRPATDRQLILQDDNQLLPWLNVEENIRFPGHSPELETISTERTMELLDLVGLTYAVNRYPAQLSGGMKQRAVLARALAAQPRILLLDEPFGALDAEIRRRLHLLLGEVCRKDRVSVLLVTHDVSEALAIADTLIFMDDKGRVSQGEANPLGGSIQSRNLDGSDFHRHYVRIRKRYGSLIEAVDF